MWWSSHYSHCLYRNENTLNQLIEKKKPEADGIKNANLNFTWIWYHKKFHIVSVAFAPLNIAEEVITMWLFDKMKYHGFADTTKTLPILGKKYIQDSQPKRWVMVSFPLKSGGAITLKCASYLGYISDFHPPAYCITTLECQIGILKSPPPKVNSWFQPPLQTSSFPVVFFPTNCYSVLQRLKPRSWFCPWFISFSYAHILSVSKSC